MACDPVDVLKSDHRAIHSLFSRLRQRLDIDVLHQLVRELSMHDAVERMYLYPTLSDPVPADDRSAEEALDQHQRIAELLADIDQRDADDPDLPNLLNTLQAKFAVHVAVEEDEILPALRALQPTRLVDLGAKMEDAKKKAPTRPHPNVPRAGIGTRMAATGAAPIDRLRDRLTGR